MKRLGERSNQREVTKFIMENNNLISHYNISPSFEGEKELQEHISGKPHKKPRKYKLSAKRKIEPKSDLINYLETPIVDILQVVEGSGIYGDDNLVKIGVYILLQLTDKNIFKVLQLKKIFSVTFKDSSSKLILQGLLYKILPNTNNDTGCPVLELLNVNTFIQLTDKVKLLQQVSCPPNYSNNTNLYLNAYTRREIPIDINANEAAKLQYS